MTVNRLKLYYDFGTIASPLVVSGNNAILGTKVLTNGPTVLGNPDRYGNLLEPNNILLTENLVDYAITGIFVPSSMTAPSGASGETAGEFLTGTLPYPAAVGIGADYPLQTNGANNTVGAFTHAGPSPSVTFNVAGTYEIDFQVAGVEPNQMVLTKNGSPIADTVFGSGAGTQQNNGTAIVVMAAGDVMTIRNAASSSSAVTLALQGGGPAANNAVSLFVKRLGASATPLQGVVSVKWQNAVTHAAVDDPATAQQVEAVVSIQGMSGGTVSGTLYIQKQHSIES